MSSFWRKVGFLSAFSGRLTNELGLDKDDLPDPDATCAPRPPMDTECIHRFDNPPIKHIKRKSGIKRLHMERQTRQCIQCGAVSIRERRRGGSEDDWVEILEPKTGIH